MKQALMYFALTILGSAALCAEVTPSAPREGRFVLKGQVSEDEKSQTLIDRNGKSRFVSGLVTEQQPTYEICRFRTDDSGRAVAQSLSACRDGILNEPLKLPAGTYRLKYQEMIDVVEITGGMTKTIELIKVIAPEVDDAYAVRLVIDMTDRTEQNKGLFAARLLDEPEILNSFSLTDWSRENISRFFTNGDFNDVTSTARATIFTPNGEHCTVNPEGRIADCQKVQVGFWERKGLRLVKTEKVSFQLFPPKEISSYEERMQWVQYSWNRAYFLVLPGAYRMEWFRNSGETIGKTLRIARP